MEIEVALTVVYWIIQENKYISLFIIEEVFFGFYFFCGFVRARICVESYNLNNEAARSSNMIFYSFKLKSYAFYLIE